MFWRNLAVSLFLLMVTADGACADGIRSTRVEGTSFRVTLASGKELGPNDLVGAIMTLDFAGIGKRAIRIKGVSPDPRDKDGEVLLYEISMRDDASGEWRDACSPDPDGKRRAFPLQGQWDRTGRRISGKGLTLACTDGAIAKCVRLGYKPWKTRPDGTSLARYHQACVHLIRADYCGDNSATTVTGTPIDIYDAIGIQQRAENSGMPFEAAWDENGAICVAHTRIEKNMTLGGLARTCPRLIGRLGNTNCLEDAERKADRAILFNRSR